MKLIVDGDYGRLRQRKRRDEGERVVEVDVAKREWLHRLLPEDAAQRQFGVQAGTAAQIPSNAARLAAPTNAESCQSGGTEAGRWRSKPSM